MTHLLRDTLRGTQHLMKDPGSGHLLKGAVSLYIIKFYNIAYPLDFVNYETSYKAFRLTEAHLHNWQYYQIEEHPQWRFSFYLSTYLRVNAADFPGDQGDEIYLNYWWVRFHATWQGPGHLPAGFSAYYGFWARSWGQHTGRADLRYWQGDYGKIVSLGYRDDPYDPWVEQLYWPGGEATISKYRDE